MFGQQLRFPLGHEGYVRTNNFPLLATKFTNFHAILVELLWFLKGGTDTDFLHEHNVHIWDDWADSNGYLGPVYGAQWRSFGLNDYADEKGVDQIAGVIESIRENPWSRRHIVTAWNPIDVEDMALPPCHAFFQFNVRPDREVGNKIPVFLDCQMYQRSADVFLGVPFNIASYALLTKMIAHITGLVPGELIISFGDVHLYKNHFAQAAELLNRDDSDLMKPNVQFQGPIKEIEDFNVHNVILRDYEYLPAIKAPIAV